MSGYWVVEVTDNGETYFATKPWDTVEARFEEQADAEDFSEEVLTWYERYRPDNVVHIELAFVSDMGDKYRAGEVADVPVRECEGAHSWIGLQPYCSLCGVVYGEHKGAR